MLWYQIKRNVVHLKISNNSGGRKNKHFLIHIHCHTHTYLHILTSSEQLMWSILDGKNTIDKLHFSIVNITNISKHIFFEAAVIVVFFRMSGAN